MQKQGIINDDHGRVQKIKVVVKFKHGDIIKGTTLDFFPNKPLFHIETLHGEVRKVIIEDLKAIFFVKDFEGSKEHTELYDDHITGGGRKIKVRYNDGEEIIGYTLGYSPERQGFIVTPADLDCNNDRIFIVKSATEKINFIM